ncbi:DegT/DnrJ/EryC1/StrS family aminotransferase [[Bacillus] enclensis]|uniref:DegT/DnrJ/EryC1/StrS family aminotransferase n=1 Tax=[Bacillus] enclensis TaxID=1402860 RepID=UPI0018DE70DA|nr:DegT/DnrJ/EryC1/StrS family aminotransferase [[Bacillus] enclensis]MBH9966626.1 DegT/DnrJ/EryC1/StrS family aminotransferase [[Bacillus] enclensis]
MNKDLIFESPVTVTQPSLPDFESYMSYVKEIWDRKWLTNNGPVHEDFKKQLKQYLHSSNVELFTNGHLALEVSLKALGLTGEVITTPFTFASTIHAIRNCNLEPVFCDIDPNKFNIDPLKIEELITERTSAILAVHVFGQPCDVSAIEEIADKHGLKVVYDAAHAFGVEVDGKGIANFGDVSMFSFHATKVFHSIEGGMLSYSDDSLTPVLNAYKNFGMTSPEDINYIGTNAKMNEFQAAMGLCNLEIVDNEIKSRGEAFKRYMKELDKLKDIQLMNVPDAVKPNYSYFPVLLKDQGQRDFLSDQLAKYKVIARKYFYPLCSQFECYDYDANETPIALNVSNRVLCLPMHANLSVQEVSQICEIIQYELGDKSEGTN